MSVASENTGQLSPLLVSCFVNFGQLAYLGMQDFSMGMTSLTITVEPCGVSYRSKVSGLAVSSCHQVCKNLVCGIFPTFWCASNTASMTHSHMGGKEKP